MSAELVDRPVRGRHAWWLWVIGGGLLVAVYSVVSRGTDSSLLYLAIGVLSVAAMSVGLRLHRPSRRWGWYMLIANQSVWVLADAIGSVLAARGEGDLFPTVADVFYLLGYPLLGAALVLLTRGRRPARDVEGLLDGLTVAIALLLLSWVLLAAPTAAASSTAPLAAAVGAAYPLLDVVVFVLLAQMVTTPGARTASLQLLFLALALIIVADMGAAGLQLLAFDATGPLDALWLFAYVLTGAAVLHPSVRALSVPVPAERGRLSRSRVLATVLATLVAPATLITEHLLGQPISVWSIALSSAAMFLLVVGRMTLVIRQIAAVQADRERAQAALAYEATHDSLTGLPNRAQSLHLIGASMARAQRSGAMLGLLFVDLDGFKAVNDSYGHQSGDEVLRAVAARMTTAVRLGDTVGRLGGDEFVVLLEPVVETESAMAVAERLIAAVSAPIPLSNGHPVRVGASVGVAASQDAGIDAEALMNEADTAAYRAKRMGRGRVEVFGEALRRELHERAEVERGLRRAIAEDTLVVRYAPVVDVTNGVVSSYEAQVAWDRPGVGLVPAEQFRPVAALSDLVIDLDSWLLRRALADLASWGLVGDGRALVGVEISARHVARSRVVEDVRSAIAEAGVEPGQLVLEISDRSSVDRVVGYAHLDQIRSTGVVVGLVHFGVGHSSVRRLQQLPIDAVRLEGDFTDWHTTSGATLLRLTVEGVQNFGLPLFIGGVVDGEHVALLEGMGCDRMLGPHFGEPLTADQVAASRSRVGVR